MQLLQLCAHVRP